VKPRGSSILAIILLAVLFPACGNAGTICTIVADADHERLVLEEGDCRTRVTPASTFKLPLALMGYDTGILVDEHAPRLPYRKEYVDWGGDAWRQPTDPKRWLKYSVVWYSRQLTRSMGQERIEGYLSSFKFGNADFSGDPGKNNGLDRAWLSSSLEISPEEQIAFLRKFVNRTLPVSMNAHDLLEKTVEQTRLAKGWVAWGKTGSAYPRKQDGGFDRSRAYGWYVGWARNGSRTIVFARLIQDDSRQQVSAGVRARQSLLDDLPLLGEPMLR
jgi:beta-lactamase class D